MYNTIVVETLLFAKPRLVGTELEVPFEGVPILLLTFPLDNDLCTNSNKQGKDDAFRYNKNNCYLYRLDKNECIHS